jgi:poly(ADP-ribose) glycohydrolase ARH3
LTTPLQDRFEGCLLGLAVGDALGGLFEAQSSERVRARFPDVESLIAYPQTELWYTDDTQMMIGVCETLIACGEIREDVLCGAFVANYVPSRGYGRGARAVLEAMEDGSDYRTVAETHFPGGSFGNGAAMRVAPVGLLFRDDDARLWDQAARSAMPTHVHPLGIEGAQLLAMAVAICSRMVEFKRESFLDELLSATDSEIYRSKLFDVKSVQTPDDLFSIGNEIEAFRSVPTAIASFVLSPDSYERTIANAVFLGGDTDTIAAMAGALSGAYLGIDCLPNRLLNLLESSPKGRVYIRRLAVTLFNKYRSGQDEK